MSIERIFRCDGPDCETNVRSASTRPQVPGFLTVTESAGRSLHFCSWDCILRQAATMPPVQTIPLIDEG